VERDIEKTSIKRMEGINKNLGQDLSRNCSLGRDKNPVPDKIMEDLEEEGISRFQVMSLFSEMEMIGENAENIWEEGMETGDVMEGANKGDVMETLPAKLLLVFQKLAREDHNQAGFVIPDKHQDQAREVGNADDVGADGTKEGQPNTRGWALENKVGFYHGREEKLQNYQ
jgi:hypothetical protein